MDRRQATRPLVADLDGTVDRPGPRFRLSRGSLGAARPAAIVLDEPTNHLDTTSTQVMERALTHFPGAVMAVSHDRFVVDKLADRLLVFDGGPRVRKTAATGAL